MMLVLLLFRSANKGYNGVVDFNQRWLFSFLSQHMRSPSVSCLDVDTTPPSSDSTPATLTPSTPTKSHRRSASCGNNPPNSIPGSGPDMRIIRIRMDLQDGNLYRSILVRTQNNLKSNFRRQRDYTKCSDWNYPRHAALTAFSSYLRKRSRNDSHQNQIFRKQWAQDIISANQAVLVSLLHSSLPSGYEQWQDPHCDQLRLRKAQSGPQAGIQIWADPTPAWRKR